MMTKSPAWFRRGCLNALAIALLGIVPERAIAQQVPARSSATQSAYAAAMKCFVANGRAIGEKERAGDAAGAARYEQMARRSFDTAMRLGRSLSYSNARLTEDLNIAQMRELPAMVNDRAYFESVVATCRAIELM